MCRACIDDLDEEIIQRIRARIQHAQIVMADRVEVGEPRRDLYREAKVIHRYQDALGFSGAMIAQRLLMLAQEETQT